MNYYVYFCISLLIFTIIKSLIRVRKSSNLLKKDYEFKEKLNETITIIIPAMNEVNNVEKSVSYFKGMKNLCNIIYVTTSKEKSKATYQKIKEEIKNQKTSNIAVIDCPNTEGTMATQLNYIIKNLNSKDIFAIYNIDSKPERKTFEYVLENIKENIVLQQVSYFDDSLRGIMKSAENWQNRWSIVYEMARYSNNKKIQFKYCIGHGLFMRKEIIEKVGYFSESEINEDNDFGYRLNINNIDIKPIPFMEQADFAKTKKIYIKQQSTWVNGPLYAFSYYKNNNKSFKNLLLAILNFKAFISWWLFPLLCYSSLICSTYMNIYIFLFNLLLIIIYVSGINFLANKLLIEIGYIKQEYKLTIVSDLLFFMVHSFGSYITLYKLFTGKNNIKNKYNTEK